jgi:hypothetical protein
MSDPDTPDLSASEATVFILTPLHPKAEEYAAKRFKKLIRPGEDGLSPDQNLALADGVREFFLTSHEHT